MRLCSEITEIRDKFFKQILRFIGYKLKNFLENLAGFRELQPKWYSMTDPTGSKCRARAESADEAEKQKAF